MKSFFPMGRGEGRLLVFLIVMAAISFLPMWRAMEVGGMAVFGWLLAGLMILSPALALLVFRRADRTARRTPRPARTGLKRPEGEALPSGSEGDREA